MPWFKVDDKLHGHRKTRRALRTAGKRRDSAAMGLWSLAGSWCADNMTDGFVPADELDRWDDDAPGLAQRLVDADYWTATTVDGEPGFQFNNWDEYQPTKAEIEAARQKKVDAGRKGGVASGRSRREARGSAGASGLVELPTRPDPSRPAAADNDMPPQPVDNDLPGELAILRSKLEARKLTVRWDKLTAEHRADMIELVDVHGDAALVNSAMASFRADSPPVFAQAWIKGWQALPHPTDRHLALVKREKCSEHRATPLNADGTCPDCIIDARVGGDR